MPTNETEGKPAAPSNDLTAQTLYHGTKADLKQGHLIIPGFSSNYGSRKNALFVYLSATLEAATWGAELAVGDGPGRIYIVEPTGPIEDDPNLTDKKFRVIQQSRTVPGMQSGLSVKSKTGRDIPLNNSKP
jgi:hypothetical protein